jgi:CDP-diacylglycerol---serine O-phosphatidyltransferase
MSMPRSALPISITFLSGFCGFAALIIVSGHPPGSKQLALAGQLIMFAMVLDGLDGNIARAMRATSTLGAQLDTFMDFMSFGLAPALLFLTMNGDTPVALAAVTFFVGSSAFRLARFRVHTEQGQTDHFTGLPITIAASWIAFLAVLEGWHPGIVAGTIGKTGAIVVLVILSIMQVTGLKYPKPTQSWSVYLAISAIISGSLVAKQGIGSILVFAVLCGGAAYCSIPFLILLARALRNKKDEKFAEPRPPIEAFLAPVSWTYFVMGSLKSAALFTIFSIVYYAADWYNIARGASYAIHFQWELELYPFWAWSSLVYESPVLMIAALPCIIRSSQLFDEYIKRYLVCIFVSGIIFVLLPTTQEYPVIQDSVGFDVQKIAWWADQANGYYNCFPSLHVINVILQAQWAGIGKSFAVRFWVWAWVVLVSLSTLTMHSHYLFDILGAVLLAWLVDKWFAWIRHTPGPAVPNFTTLGEVDRGQAFID